MDIRTAAHYMKLGYRIRRSFWEPEEWVSEKLMGSYAMYYSFGMDDLLADDWELITDGIIKDFPLTYADD